MGHLPGRQIFLLFSFTILSNPVIFIPLAALLLMPAPIFPRWPFDWTRADTFASISTRALSMECCWPSFRSLWSSCQCLPSLLPEPFLRPPGCLRHCSGSPPASVSPVVPPLLHLLHLDSKWWPLQRCYRLLSLLSSTVSLRSLPSGCKHSWHSRAKCRSVGLFHFWVSKGSTDPSSFNLLLSPPCYKSQTVYLTAFLHGCPDYSLPLEFSALLHSIILLLATWLEM